MTGIDPLHSTSKSIFFWKGDSKLVFGEHQEAPSDRGWNRWKHPVADDKHVRLDASVAAEVTGSEFVFRPLGLRLIYYNSSVVRCGS